MSQVAVPNAVVPPSVADMGIDSHDAVADVAHHPAVASLCTHARPPFVPTNRVQKSTSPPAVV